MLSTDRAPPIVELLDGAHRLRKLHQREIPSCIRAPPDADTEISVVFAATALSQARVNFSPTTLLPELP